MDFPGIYVTGNVVVDTLVKPADALPEWGSTTYVESISMGLGGNASGAACAAAMMGVPTIVTGMVGADAPGEFARNRMEECGVDITRLLTHADEPTAATVALIHSGGERLFFHVVGACGVFSPDDISFEPDAIEGCKYFHYGSIFCLPSMRNHASTVLQRAKDAGLTTSLDTDWDTDDEWGAVVDPICGLVDYLFVNTLEGERITGSNDPRAIAEHLISAGAGAVVVKTGADGCHIFDARSEIHSPGFDVPVADTTGAGDCFCGAFIASLARGNGVATSARMANALAAHSIQSVGNTSGLVPYDQIVSWLGSAP